MKGKRKTQSKPSVISLFTGAMGLDIGFEKAGFETRVGVEVNKYALETIKLNRPDIARIDKPIEKVPTSEILGKAGLKVGEATLVIGGPSCQSFSTAGHRKSVKDPRGALFKQFIRVVKEARPRFFVMENVRGILSAAIKHRPLKERGPGFPPLKPEERLGSGFTFLLKELKKTGYYITYDLLNAADYGTPQIRHRVIIIGSRDGEPLHMPEKTHDQKGEAVKKWTTLREALKGLRQNPKPQYCPIPKKWKKYMMYVPQGGCWTSIPKKRQRWAMGKAYTSWGGRKGFFRRLAWDQPAPSLTTEPASKATMICHPTRLRPLAIAEYRRVQEFPDDWKFAGNLSHIYIQIGNAVPVGLGRAIGRAVSKLMKHRKRADKELLGRVCCAREDLAERIKNREKTTVLNPTRMRKYKSLAAAKRWLAASRGKAGPVQRKNASTASAKRRKRLAS